jgi:hypothetical protein
LITAVVVMVLVGPTALSCTATTETPAEEDLASARDSLRPAVTKEERDDFIEECLAEFGLAGVFERRPGGGFTASGVGENEISIMQQCRESASERWPDPPPPVSATEFAALYDLYMKQAECLEQEGYEVEPPSLDRYIDIQGNWVPYDDLPEMHDGQEWLRINEACPQSPWAYETASNSE